MHPRQLFPANTELRSCRTSVKTCPAIVQDLLREPRVGPTSDNYGRFEPLFGQIWPSLADNCPISVEIGRFGPVFGHCLLANSARLGQYLPILAGIERSEPNWVSCWPALATSFQTMAQLGNTSSKLGRISAPGATAAQVLGNFVAPSQLDWFVRQGMHIRGVW